MIPLLAAVMTENIEYLIHGLPENDVGEELNLVFFETSRSQSLDYKAKRLLDMRNNIEEFIGTGEAVMYGILAVFGNDSYEKEDDCCPFYEGVDGIAMVSKVPDDLGKNARKQLQDHARKHSGNKRTRDAIMNYCRGRADDEDKRIFWDAVRSHNRSSSYQMSLIEETRDISDYTRRLIIQHEVESSVAPMKDNFNVSRLIVGNNQVSYAGMVNDVKVGASDIVQGEQWEADCLVASYNEPSVIGLINRLDSPNRGVKFFTNNDYLNILFSRGTVPPWAGKPRE